MRMRHTLTIFLLLLVTPAWGELPVARRTELLHILQHDCGSCHGLTLKGGLGPPLTPDALIGKPAELLADTIRLGRTGTAMPPWQPLLAADEIQWLVNRLLQGDEEHAAP